MRRSAAGRRPGGFELDDGGWPVVWGISLPPWRALAPTPATHAPPVSDYGGLRFDKIKHVEASRAFTAEIG